jgi:peptide/nickel transport system permease protein
MQMLTYTLRRLLLAIPTLLFISLIIFLLVDFAPGSPMSMVPLTVPPDVKQKMMEALGADKPLLFRYLLWLKQFFLVEPAYFINWMFGTDFYADAQRVVSWQSRNPVMDNIFERLPQTLTVIGCAYLVGASIAIPIGIYSAYRQYSWFDQLGTFVSMIGFSVPTFFSGVVLIVIFSSWLGWFPSVYDTTLNVTDWPSFWKQVRQMAMPVMVLGLFNAAQISRYMRSSMLENLGQDYVRTARAKGMSERVVVLKHVLRNSLIPVVTVLALEIPGIFGGAIVTEQVFKINGIGGLLIGAINASDLPTVQTVAFIIAVMIVLFNLFADIIYGLLDPRIRYD